MPDTSAVPRAKVEPGSRLEDLLAAYAHLKPQADEVASRLKAVTDAIKVELTTLVPGAARIDVAHEALARPLRLSWIEKWDLDAKRMKAEDPATYVRFARKGGSWQLRGVSG
jgi:hypothetical protein